MRRGSPSTWIVQRSSIPVRTEKSWRLRTGIRPGADARGSRDGLEELRALGQDRLLAAVGEDEAVADEVEVARAVAEVAAVLPVLPARGVEGLDALVDPIPDEAALQPFGRSISAQ